MKKLLLTLTGALAIAGTTVAVTSCGSDDQTTAKVATPKLTGKHPASTLKTKVAIKGHKHVTHNAPTGKKIKLVTPKEDHGGTPTLVPVPNGGTAIPPIAHK